MSAWSGYTATIDGGGEAAATTCGLGGIGSLAE
jgi:hypothetical protein